MALPKLKRPTITDFLTTVSEGIKSKVNGLSKDSAGKNEQQVASPYIEAGVMRGLEVKPHVAAINPDLPNRATVTWEFDGNLNLLGYTAPDGTIPEKVDGKYFSEFYEYPTSIVASTELRDEVAKRIESRTAFLKSYASQLTQAVTEHNRRMREEIPLLVAERLKVLNGAKSTEDFLNKRY